MGIESSGRILVSIMKRLIALVVAALNGAACRCHGLSTSPESKKRSKWQTMTSLLCPKNRTRCRSASIHMSQFAIGRAVTIPLYRVVPGSTPAILRSHTCIDRPLMRGSRSTVPNGTLLDINRLQRAALHSSGRSNTNLICNYCMIVFEAGPKSPA